MRGRRAWQACVAGVRGRGAWQASDGEVKGKDERVKREKREKTPYRPLGIASVVLVCISLRIWRDFVRECFCFGSEAVRGLVKSRENSSRALPARNMAASPTHASRQLRRLGLHESEAFIVSSSFVVHRCCRRGLFFFDNLWHGTFYLSLDCLPKMPL